MGDLTYIIDTVLVNPVTFILVEIVDKNVRSILIGWYVKKFWGQRFVPLVSS